MDAVLECLRRLVETVLERALGAGHRERIEIRVPDGQGHHFPQEADEEVGRDVILAGQAAAVELAAGAVRAEPHPAQAGLGRVLQVLLAGRHAQAQGDRLQQCLRVEVVALAVGIRDDVRERSRPGAARDADAVHRSGLRAGGTGLQRSADLPRQGDIAPAAGHLNALRAEEVVEIVGAGEGAEGVRALQGVAPAVRREGTRDLAHGGERGVHVVERIGRAGRTGDGVVLVVHPGGVGILDAVVHRGSGSPGGDIEILCVFEEIEAARTGAVVGAQVVETPAEVPRRVVSEIAGVAEDAAFDAADAGVIEQLRPGAEGGAETVRALGARSRRGVAAAEDVHIPVQRAVLDGAGVAQPRLETEIGAQQLQRHARGQELDVGGRDEFLAMVDRDDRVAVRAHRQDAHDRGAERLLRADRIDGLLRLGPGNTSSRAPCHEQERD